ncbi:MAG TPA: DUF6434 domain-containing protein [Gammaproteobacteria bacterium]|jgi:hypothetical protein|nr:DUF6434 domain-containing protein [Gammaproteobacteria bacterium]
MERKPNLNKIISIDHFKNWYWLKVELINFCKKHDLSTVGSKQELVQRITLFLITGNKIEPTSASKANGHRDSQQFITRNTLVANYKNDAATRKFFIDQIGKHFRFDAYLRQFTNKNNITKKLTYGDLVDGWLIEESRRKDPAYQSNIGKQFEYNQFIRDFFANEKGKSRSDAIKAWEIIKTAPGCKTYIHYKSIMSCKVRK